MSSRIPTKHAAHGPTRIKTTTKARSKRRSTLPNQTQYGSTLLGENLSKYKHGTLRLNLPP